MIAGDSTKLRAQNSKKNNFNQKKIDRHLEYIENKLAEYNKALAESYGDEKAMGNMLERAEKILETNDFTALFDKATTMAANFKKPLIWA